MLSRQDGPRSSTGSNGKERPVVLPQLRRVRWAVRATLVLGVAASVVANVLHALDNPISQAIAAWPPLALLLTVELISRVPVHRRSLAAARLVATATIAGIAAWVSYWHMAGVAARYGETGASPYLLPLSVDGLIVVASICLVELGGRISALENEAATSPNEVAAPLADETAIPGLIPGPAKKLPPSAAKEIAGLLGAAPRPGRPPAPAARATPPGESIPELQPTATRRPRKATAETKPAGKAPARRTPAETVAVARRIKAVRPQITEAELAAELGISVSRWRTIRREAVPANHGLAA
jgi:Protein of unknown function (DUF2637)